MTNREYLQWLLSPACKQRPPWRVNHLAETIGVDRLTLTRFLTIDGYKLQLRTHTKIARFCDQLRAKA